MTKWAILNKIFLSALSFFLVIVLTFLLMKTAPGDPFQDEQNFSKEVVLSLHKHYGLDLPSSSQFFRYLYSVLTFDFGPSLTVKERSVNEILREGFPISLFIGCEALLIALFGGTAFGVFMAICKNRWLLFLSSLFLLLGISIPSFLLATLFQYLFAIKLPLLPIAQWGSFSHTVLPALALAAFPFSMICRLIKTRLSKELASDYIKCAKGFGISRATLTLRYALPNALYPLLGYLSHSVAIILTGSFVIEKIFAIPGLGYWFVGSVISRDYPVIMATTVLYTLIVLLTGFLCELLHLFLDPRLREAGNAG